MRFLYTFLFYLCLPLIMLRLLWRAIRVPAYARRWRERFGFVSPPEWLQSGTVIWVHAVSVGETLAAAPLIKKLLDNPRHTLVLTTTTPTGSEQAVRLFGDYFASRLFHVYAPYDLPDCVARFLRRIEPSRCIIMETELWPNTINGCYQRQIPVLLANGRLSEKSFRGYRKIQSLIGPALQQLSVVAMQQQADAERMQALGVPPSSLVITGNIKFDFTVTDELQRSAADVRRLLTGKRPVWIAASTHRGEDEILLRVFARVRREVPDVLLLLVPRHPERFTEVERLVLNQFLPIQRLSERQSVKSTTQVVLGDTMGELQTLYGCADLAFVGGSLVPVGGHNLMEPAAWGLPMLSGSQLFNFAEASRLLRDAGGLFVSDDPEQLAGQLVTWLKDEKARRQAGEQARRVADANGGALDRLLVLVTEAGCVVSG